MHEILISYSSKHRGLTRKLEKAIEAQYGPGSVWRDNKLESWGSFEGHIRAKAESARAIVVIWNEDAESSDSIKSEAHSALKLGQLVNVALDSFPAGKIPLPYSIYRVTPLSDIEGILESIAGVMAGKPLEMAVPAEEEEEKAADPLPDPAQEKLEAAAPLKEDAARDDGSPLPGAVREEQKTAAHFQEDAARDGGGSVASAMREKVEAVAPLENGAAHDRDGPLAGLALEKSETAVPLGGVETFDYRALLSGVMWEEPKAAAPVEKDSAPRQSDPLPGETDAEPEAAASPDEDAARDRGDPLPSAAEEEFETVASPEEDDVRDRTSREREIASAAAAPLPQGQESISPAGTSFYMAPPLGGDGAAESNSGPADEAFRTSGQDGPSPDEDRQELEAAAPPEEDDIEDDGSELLDAKQESLKSDPREILPSELLQARYAAVPFNDAAGAKRDCLAWCRDAALPAAGRLYRGPGGIGKTRLLIEVAAELREAGWTAGFLNRDFDGDEAQRKQAWQALERRVLRGKDAGLLIVLDSAEARQAEAVEIAQLLLRHRANTARPLRLVLLTRGASPWWERLREEHEEIGRLFAGAPDALALSPMASAAARQSLFKESTLRFWPPLQAQGFARPTAAPSRERLERITKGDGFERPLAIQMEALLYLCATPLAAGNGIDKQLGKVLDLEHARWKELLRPLAEALREDLEHGAAQVTAVGGTPSEAATAALLMADEFYKDRRDAPEDVAPALQSLARFYGYGDGGVDPIEPGLLGEHHVATIADAELIEGCLAWIDTQPEAGREARTRHLIATLQSAASAGHGVWAGKAAVVLDGLVLHQMSALAADFAAVLMSTPGPLKGRIEVLLGALDFDSLRALDLALPKSPPELLEFAHKVSARHATQAAAALGKLRSKGADANRLEFALKDVAEALGSVGNRLSALGKHEEALNSSLEAARIYRHLACARADVHAPDLAIFLRGLGQIHLAKGQSREAVATAEEALAAIAPFFEKAPQIFWGLVEGLIADYAVACNCAGMDGNAGLVDRIEAVIERAKIGAIENSTAPEMERARFRGIQELFEKAQETGALDEKKLAKLAPESAKQARALWMALQR